MLFCISFEDLFFYLLTKKADFSFSGKQIKELISKKVMKFIFRVVIIGALYKIVLQVI